MFFTIEKIEKQLREIQTTIHRGKIDIPNFKIYPGECPGAEGAGFDDAGWTDFKTGQTWGGYDQVAWFRARVPIPGDWRGRKLALRFLVGPRDGGKCTAETLLYVNGSPLQGIDVWHEEAWLPPEALLEDEIHIALRAWSGVLAPPDCRRFKLAQLVWIDEPAERFYYRADTMIKSIKLLDENDLRRTKLLSLLNHAFGAIDFCKPRSEAYYRSLQEAGECLEAGLAQLQTREIKPRVIGVGHSHIDLAWLWRQRHTREKAARTFSTVLNLMRQYPEYRFMHSSPQLYAFLRQDYPEIYAWVKERIASGEWSINGGMWVEADTNLTSGESLVRQFLFGKRFARREFGVDMQVLWLPDVFGYSGSLPQIARKSGMKYFLTSKISWSQFNRFPYDTFYWRGIDGSELLTYFVTTPDPGSHFYTYNGQLSPADVKGTWDQYRQKDANDELMLLYGWGDGGGGPTREMLEYARGLENMPGLPEVRLEVPEPFFERLARRVAGQDLPVWDGELYLEYHRGTYTSQARNKRSNRQAEILYHDVEWLASLAAVLGSREAYPVQALQAGWELILFNQFHDVLPGSSIPQVYEDSRLDYEKVFEIGRGALQRAKAAVIDRLPAGLERLVVFNPLACRRGGLIELPWSEVLEGKTILAGDRRPAPVQVVETAGEKKLLLEAPAAPSLGYRVEPLVEAGPDPKSEIQVSASRLENGFYKIELNERGQITSLWDKRLEREVLAQGACANVFQAFEDKPLSGDAWDIDIYYQEKLREVGDLVEAVVEETGPLRGSLRLAWRFSDSTITQRMRLYRSSPRIDFSSEVDWHEHQTLLKVAFPVAVRATQATYEIQFGSLERPTHWNTSWDWARFEVPGHKWADLSEGDYGVALLNDCKYGYDVKGNVLRLTLIKSGIEPDPQADQGRHVFTYSLLPHAGDWRSGGVVEAAYDLNDPLLAECAPASTGGNLPPSYEFARVEAENVLIETVKQAEDGDGWIVRLYEFKQCRANAVRLVFGRPLRGAVECNLVEEEERPVAWEVSMLTFPIGPFEVKTFKVWF